MRLSLARASARTMLAPRHLDLKDTLSAATRSMSQNLKDIRSAATRSLSDANTEGVEAPPDHRPPVRWRPTYRPPCRQKSDSMAATTRATKPPSRRHGAQKAAGSRHPAPLGTILGNLTVNAPNSGQTWQPPVTPTPTQTPTPNPTRAGGLIQTTARPDITPNAIILRSWSVWPRRSARDAPTRSRTCWGATTGATTANAAHLLTHCGAEIQNLSEIQNPEPENENGNQNTQLMHGGQDKHKQHQLQTQHLARELVSQPQTTSPRSTRYLASQRASQQQWQIDQHQRARQAPWHRHFTCRLQRH